LSAPLRLTLACGGQRGENHRRLADARLMTTSSEVAFIHGRPAWPGRAAKQHLFNPLFLTANDGRRPEQTSRARLPDRHCFEVEIRVECPAINHE